MKKPLFLLGLLLGISFLLEAQVNPHAIGVRFDQGTLFGVEASYQHGLDRDNRLELGGGAGFTHNSFRAVLVGSFHWDFNIVNGFNWFLGPAATIGYYTFENSNDYFNVGVGGQIGLEYDFNVLRIPLLISIDTRPLWDIPGHASGVWWGAAIAARYTF